VDIKNITKGNGNRRNKNNRETVYKIFCTQWINGKASGYVSKAVGNEVVTVTSKRGGNTFPLVPTTEVNDMALKVQKFLCQDKHKGILFYISFTFTSRKNRLQRRQMYLLPSGVETLVMSLALEKYLVRIPTLY
jgi:hypothetical protein